MRHPFLRTLAGSTATPTDPNFENVTLLLHGDGTNGGQNNTFVDGSTNNFTITRNGNTTQGTFSPYGDNWSNYFDGTGDLVRASVSSLSSSSFTVECWIFYSGATNAQRTIYDFAAAANGYGMFAYHSSSGNIVLSLHNANSAPGFATISASFSGKYNQWVHFAVSYDGSTYQMFLDGVSVGTPVSSATQVVSLNSLTVGARSDTTGTQVWVGYISNFRYVTGAALYTGTFTPATSPLAVAGSGTTRLLTCQSNRFVDNSSSPLTLTVAGNPSVQRFSPFSPTAAYAAGTIGGSGYFDGTDDYLAVADNSNLRPGAGAFTIEAWIYRNATGAAHTIYAKGGASTGIVFQVTSGNVLRFTHTTTSIDSTGIIPGSSWNHVAVVREGTGTNQTKLYINGVQDGQGTVSTDFTQTEEVRVGTNRGATEDLNGYLSDVRFVKGTAVYTATFTPPSSPLSAITDTQFLCVFQNASILDNAMMAVPETVGNAQIDTTTKKFGTGSLEFDGTGDYLTIRNNPAFSFGTGDFTIECWVYIAGNSAPDGGGNRTAGLFSAYAPSGVVSRGYTFEVEGNASTTGTGLSFYNNVSGSQTSVIATTTISQTTWHHVAVTRSGTTTRLFLNGTLIGSGTLGNQNVNSDYPAVVGRLGYASYLQELNGYIDDLRITKGVARYTADFTPPTAAFPDL